MSVRRFALGVNRLLVISVVPNRAIGDSECIALCDLGIEARMVMP